MADGPYGPEPRVTRVISDSSSGAWEFTVSRSPEWEHGTVKPLRKDVPDDIRLALLNWLNGNVT